MRLELREVERLFLGMYKKDGHAEAKVSSVPRLPFPSPWLFPNSYIV